MTVDRPGDDPEQVVRIGTFRDCLFDIVAGDLTTVEADVAVAALCSRQAGHHHLGAGVDALDRALRGALARLRSDAIFTGAWGETLYLSSLPSTVRVSGVIMLGLGPTGRNTAGKVRRALTVAASQAARMGASRTIFAPVQLGSGSSRSSDVATARAVLLGISDALASGRCGVRRWSFVTPAPQVEPVARQFAMAIRRIVEHEDAATNTMGTIRKGLWQIHR